MNYYPSWVLGVIFWNKKQEKGNTNVSMVPISYHTCKLAIDWATWQPYRLGQEATIIAPLLLCQNSNLKISVTNTGTRWNDQNYLTTKQTKWYVCSAKTQIIHPVWSESSQLRSAEDPIVNSEDWSNWADAQAERSLCLARRSFCWFCQEAAHIESVMLVLNTNWKSNAPVICNYGSYRARQ